MNYPRRIGFGRFISSVLTPTLVVGTLLTAGWLGVFSYQKSQYDKAARQNYFWEALANQKSYDSSSSAGQFTAELQPLLDNLEPEVSSRLRLTPQVACNRDCYPELEEQIGRDPFVNIEDTSLKRLDYSFLEDLRAFNQGGSSAVRVPYPYVPRKTEQAAPFIFAGTAGIYLLLGTMGALGRFVRRRTHPNRHRIEQSLRDLERAWLLPEGTSGKEQLIKDLQRLIRAYESEPEEVNQARIDEEIRVLSDDIRERLCTTELERKSRVEAREELKSWGG